MENRFRGYVSQFMKAYHNYDAENAVSQSFKIYLFTLIPSLSYNIQF